MNMKVKFIVTLIIIQIIIIAFLVYTVYKKQKNVLGTTSINFINKESVTFNPSENLRYFYEPKTGTQYDTWIQKATYTINTDSLNEEYDYPINKDKDTYRIISLGDSFTFGLHVDTKDTWPNQLEVLLNTKIKCKNIKKIEVINLGVNGYDIRYSVERYKLRGQKYKPNLVLWFLTEWGRINEFWQPIINKRLTELENNPQYIKTPKPELFSMSWDFAREESNKKLDDKSIVEYQLSSLKLLDRYYRDKIILFTPWLIQNNTPFDNLLTKFIDSRKEVLLFEIRNLYEQSSNIFPNDGHPNQKGHKIIANDVFQYLLENKIIPCN